MAQRRMFTLDIVDSDAFLEMPLSTQALYFHLGMRADDDGFINNAMRILRTIGANKNDYDLLLAKRFILDMEDGIIVIKHWKMHNYIPKDRYKPTQYKEKKALLSLKENNSYTDRNTLCIQNVYSLDTQDRLGKDRLGKDNIIDTDFVEEDKPLTINQLIENYLSGKSECFKIAFNEFVAMKKSIKNAIKTEYQLKLLTNKLDKLSSNEDEQIEIINNAVMNSWKGFYPLDKNKTNNNFKPKKSNTNYHQREYSESIESMIFGFNKESGNSD